MYTSLNYTHTNTLTHVQLDLGARQTDTHTQTDRQTDGHLTIYTQSHSLTYS